VLDFGCGLARTLRFVDDTAWRLSGCDVDRRLIDWCRRALPGPVWKVNAPDPPLPFEDASFDVLWSVSVFTHFDADEQALWAAEVARVLRPGALALISLMGPHALGAFPALHSRGGAALRDRGFFFEQGGEAFNERGAFHTAAGVDRLFGDHFTVDAWLEAGLDGFQDLALLIRKSP
ncbi:MAG: class I SAM-dependent methyltransferase, partial [Acidobacteriota bacterium]